MQIVWRIFGPKRGEVRGRRRKMHNEELHKFYASPDFIRVTISSMIRCWGMYHA
jgi:hypothetical protein